MYPLVSCIMPTANRPEFIKIAIASFLSQTYKNKELIILDDGKQPSIEDSLQLDKSVQYIYAGNGRKVISKKLNMLCALASGEIIARFDDDDFSSPQRLEEQVNIINEGAEFTGFHSILFYDIRTDKVYKYFSTKNYACGASFMFTKKFWEKYKFDELKILGEDNNLIDRCERKLVAINGEKLLVACIHSKTSATKTLDVSHGFIEQSKDILPIEFLNCIKDNEIAA